MSTTLRDDATRAVLDRLFSAAERDNGAFTELGSQLGSRDVSTIPTKELVDLTTEIYMPVAREVGDLLYLLTRARRPSLVVEFGTSFGISAIHLAAAVRDNGGGQVITTELAANKAKAAAENLTEAGLADLVDVRLGDAFETLQDLPGPIDLLLLDGWNQLYLPLLRALEPRLRPGALVVADDVITFADQTRDYLDHVHDPANGYVSVHVPLDDGLDVAVRA
ncbi:O-methyltransferase [Frankia sp. AgB32]|uniref:O-methyltransferase n=1 Tax=Frankia sp. AgB32 TaxID=631119 RepID=UPI00200C98EA|nr:class I SAM-dependent methyltransferase [Frankia sp. AgB32]MCK9895506.1 class I SAM-dependent methyltransferase [Frankia sp. AgB32]